ncbi:MAG TPA: FG-GAP-like repeat-containing protein [Polyangia bacterium]|nr:FG-GAP-like repeat-containing protein [Polyangia bacterium]
MLRKNVLFVLWSGFLGASLFAGGDARAGWPPADGANLKDPQNWPNDPDYGSQWAHWSFIPDSIVSQVGPAERPLGAGMHTDEAWELTPGDDRVVVASLDSGVRWGNAGTVTRMYLNRGELPPPDQGCGDMALRTDAYDANGDGVFNILDYAKPTPSAPTPQSFPLEACDTRLRDTNGNGFIDPQDLINTFSDGTDADGNGYVDDIAGWDFFEDDNDPNDDVNFGHGTSELNWGGDTINDGRGKAGVCGHCQWMPVRVGDAFIVDANAFARGVIFAVDSGAAVITEALGALSDNEFTHSAIDYAYANHVFIAGAAADENSIHQNFPVTNNHMSMVHAVTKDAADWPQAHSFLRYNNCTNYGAQLVFSAPGEGCSSESTAKLGGAAALLYSAALKYDLPFPGGAQLPTDKRGARRLTSEEVKQLFIATVDDINLNPDGSNPELYRSGPGWDQRFGYGRLHVRRAMDLIKNGTLPPEADIDDPPWFQVVDPAKQPRVTIRFHLAQRSGQPVAYVLEWAAGIEPGEGDWHMLQTGSASGMQSFEWDVSGLHIDNPPMERPDGELNRYLVTLRLRATASNGQPGQMRKALFLYHDPTLLPGYPLYLGASGEAPVKLADLDGDGKREIIVADSNGLLHALRADGTEAPGFPVALDETFGLHKQSAAFRSGAVKSDVKTTVGGAPAIGDVDGDGKPDIVVLTESGKAHVITASGHELPGWPVALDRSLTRMTDEAHVVASIFMSAPALADFDHDGKLEVVAAAGDGYLYVWKADGSPYRPFPVLVASDPATRVWRLVGSPALGDVDHDGAIDIVIGTMSPNEAGELHVISSATGRDIAGYPVVTNSIKILPYVLEGLPEAPALADVDHDGKLEVAVFGVASTPRIYRSDGSLLVALNNSDYGPGAESTDKPYVVFSANGSFADLDNDGKLDFIVPGEGFGAAASFAAGSQRVVFDHLLGCWSIERNQFLEGCPKRIDDYMFFMSASVADLDNDGIPEMVVGSGGYYVRAYNYKGAAPAGFPKLTGGWIVQAPAIGDVDGDGKLDVVVGTRNGWLYAWRTEGKVSGKIEWPSFHHDNRNTGNYETPLDQGGGGPKAGGEGCGCMVGAAAPLGAGLLGMAALALAWVLILSRRYLRFLDPQRTRRTQRI